MHALCNVRTLISCIVRAQLMSKVRMRCANTASCLQGVAINFVKSDDIRILRDIEQYYSTQVDEMVSILAFMTR